MSTTNRLALNRLALNRLALNRLALSRLALYRLSLHRLVFQSLDGLEDTPEGRDVLHYVAQCALVEDDVLVAHSGGVEYEFPGLLGVAPGWEDGALSVAQQRAVSACLLAHVNAYGASVSISIRSPGVVGADAAEMEAYQVYEGTFYGNVLDAVDLGGLVAFACQGDRADLAAAHSADRLKRVCTDLSPDCEIVAMGRCRDVCSTWTGRFGWTNCAGEDGQVYAATASTYLYANDLDGANEWCHDDYCQLGAAGGDAAILDCADSVTCATACIDGARCTVRGAQLAALTATADGSVADIDCKGAASCAATCDASASCDVDCRDSGSCGATCDGNASCAVDCRGASACSVACTDGAGCLLACAGAGSCGFSACAGAIHMCADGVVACGRPCP